VWVLAGRPHSPEQKAVLIIKSWIDARLSRTTTTSGAKPI